LSAGAVKSRLLHKKVNRSLFQLSNQLTFSEKVSFSFDSLQFGYIPKEFRTNIRNFSLTINNIPFNVNSGFFSCLSDRVFNILRDNPNLQSLDLGQKSPDYLKLFQGILSIFDGDIFPVHQVTQKDQYTQLLFEICSDLKIQELYSILIKDQQIPNSIELSLQFFQNYWFNFSSEHLNAAVRIMALNFKDLSDEQIHSIPFSLLEQILSSSDLQVGDESFLFDKLFNLYQHQSNSISIMKHVFFLQFSQILFLILLRMFYQKIYQ
jgi:hypothetical protein